MRLSAAGHPLAVWLCDFKSHSTVVLTLRAYVIRDGRSESLGKAVALIEEGTEGLFYVASNKTEDRDAVPHEIGILGDVTRSCVDAELTEVDLPQTFDWERGLTLAQPTSVAIGEEALLRAILFREKESSGTEASQGVVRQSPFASATFAEVRKVAESLADATTILITVMAQQLGP